MKKVSKVIKNHLLIHEPTDSHAYTGKNEIRGYLLVVTQLCYTHLSCGFGGKHSCYVSPHKEHAPTTLKFHHLDGSGNFSINFAAVRLTSPDPHISTLLLPQQGVVLDQYYILDSSMDRGVPTKLINNGSGSIPSAC